ncbi:6-phosphogluconate dehydrogenase C-terminal domain-like protein [Ascodesmis nigricans]|uniref:phosphogluconate dehydrogenase (NADP(+)-dependent, decarboxylating) n=1 Tax=Ascodesmis nigricans TaxID=341454 RepID=A0A4S2N0R9_9PEZI|nr:6-phosphogluconate dehydrogenase C-terminal domain-like protein [Ascodesmis nigricans]
MSSSHHQHSLSPLPKPVHAALSDSLLTTLSESWEILFKCLHTPLHEISSLYHHWSATCELACTPLLTSSQKVLTPASTTAPHTLNEVQDRIFQNSPHAVAIALDTKIAVPTLAAAHFLHVASQDRRERLEIYEKLGGAVAGAKTQRITEIERAQVMEDLRLAVYAAFLAAWIQAIGAMKPGEEKLVEGWRDTMAWSEHVAELVGGHRGGTNVMADERVAKEIQRVYPHLKRTVERAVRWDAHIPTLSASLEYLKYAGAKQLPTQFVTAMMDYWEGQGFELKNPKDARRGSHSHHYDWEKLDKASRIELEDVQARM